MGEEEKKLVKEEKPNAEAEKPKTEEEQETPKPAEEKQENGSGGDGEKKKEGGEGEAAEAPSPPPPPPEEVVMKVYMHCEGCARKVRRSLKGFEGVEDVMTDCKIGKVVVKGKKAAEDPLKVVERVQRKTGRKVELVSPQPPPPKPEKNEGEQKKEDEPKPKPEEKKEEPPVIAVVLKVHMHCEACAQEIKKRIIKMKGVQAAEPDLKESQVTVKGVIDPPKLVEYVYKRTGKQAVVVKVEQEEKKPSEDTEKKPVVDGEEKKPTEGEPKQENKSSEDEKPEEGNNAAGSEGAETAEGKVKITDAGDILVSPPEEAIVIPGGKIVELKRNEFYYYYPRYPVEYHHAYPSQAYAPQLFSDENPNACSVM